MQLPHSQGSFHTSGISPHLPHHLVTPIVFKQKLQKQKYSPLFCSFASSPRESGVKWLKSWTELLNSYIHVKVIQLQMQKNSQCADFKQSTVGTDFSSLLFSYCPIQKHNLPAARKAFDGNTELIYPPSQANSNKPGDK